MAPFESFILQIFILFYLFSEFSTPFLITVQKLLIPLAMSSVVKIGKVEKTHNDAEFQWKIPDFFSVAENKSKLMLKCPSFFFANTSWHFQMFFRLEARPAYVTVYLLQMGNLASPVKCYFGLKKVDGSIHHLTKGVVTVESFEDIGKKLRSAGNLHFDFLEVQQRKSELAPSGVLTVKCALKCKTTLSQEARLLKPSELHKQTSK